jgi:hypothetical protein
MTLPRNERGTGWNPPMNHNLKDFLRGKGEEKKKKKVSDLNGEGREVTNWVVQESLGPETIA